MHHATKSLCGECVWVSKWAAQLKTIMVAKWEVPVSKRERLPKRVVTLAFGELMRKCVFGFCFRLDNCKVNNIIRSIARSYVIYNSKC